MKRRLNLAIPALAAMLIAIALVAWAQTASKAATNKEAITEECASCHSMETQVHTWQASTHKDVACTECHADDGVRGWVHMEARRIEMALGARENPNLVVASDVVNLNVDIPNQRCLDCHARQMPWVMQDLKPAALDNQGIPVALSRDDLQFLPAVAAHDKHLTGDNPLRCVDCHKETGHGAPSGDARTSDFHDTCAKCHAEQKTVLNVSQSVTCAACHNQPQQVQPVDHQSGNWTKEHGKLAMTDIKACAQCHLSSGAVAEAGVQVADAGKAPIQLVSNDVRAQAGTKFNPQLFKIVAVDTSRDGCSNCHQTEMPHAANFLKGHATDYQQNPSLCASCHGTNNTAAKPADPKNLANTAEECVSCHAGQTMPHPTNFLSGHGAAYQQNPDACQTCHSSKNPVNPTAAYAKDDFCTSCHSGVIVPHPTNYLSIHGQAATANPTACQACHSSANTANPNASYARNDFCTSCHAGVKMPHAADFLPQHGTQAASNPKACLVCHSSANKVNPKASYAKDDFCTACHSAVTMPHPADYQTKHGAAATANPQACQTCHSPSNKVGAGQAYTKADFCTACHSTYKHDANWLTEHGPVITNAGGTVTSLPTNCQACHTSGTSTSPNNDSAKANSTCASCHGQLDLHQDDFWFIKHGDVANKQGEQSCAQCHATVKPSCSACHPNR